MTDDSPVSEIETRLDTSVAHTARVWNYWLGGKDYFASDSEVGEQILQFLPNMRTTARADRAFLGRAVRYLAGEARIRQFLDVGTGLPTADNTHEVAQAVAPQSRIVYVDNDPLVLVHARALLTSAPEGATDYLDADLHEPGKILQEAARTLDFAQPVALTLLGVLNFILDDDEAQAIVNRLLAAVLERECQAADHLPYSEADHSFLRPDGTAPPGCGLVFALAPQARRPRCSRSGSVLRCWATRTVIAAARLVPLPPGSCPGELGRVGDVVRQQQAQVLQCGRGGQSQPFGVPGHRRVHHLAGVPAVAERRPARRRHEVPPQRRHRPAGALVAGRRRAGAGRV